MFDGTNRTRWGEAQSCLTNPFSIRDYGEDPRREVSVSPGGVSLWRHAKHHLEIFMTELHNFTVAVYVPVTARSQ